MKRAELRLRKAIIDQCRWMNATGLNQGTSGNISVRSEGQMLITPSSVPYDAMEPEMIASMPIEGEEYGAWEGPKRPSTEWRFHLDIMRAKPEVGAIVHTHSIYATTLAIARKPIPACHYMVAVFGGTDVRCAPYATFGTKELSDNALEALDGRSGCLLSNHGMIATGADLEKAMWSAVELETLAKQYYLSLCIGGPVILPDALIEETAAAMSGYGLHTRPSGAKKPAARAKPAGRSATAGRSAAARRKPAGSRAKRAG